MKKEDVTLNCYNIIGDIHGRTCWKELVKDDCINIFVGDYLDPYEDVPAKQLLHNFVDIVAYKQSHPKTTILLYGNHDLHYMTTKDQSSRYDAQNAEIFRQVFEETKSLFTGVAYAIEDRALVTHAGVSKEWYEKEFGPYEGTKPSEVADDINDLWKHNKVEFTFDANATSRYDLSGESPTHSPLWIRPWGLKGHDLFAGTSYIQIFGHSQVDDIIIDDNLVCVDCLGSVVKSFQIQ